MIITLGLVRVRVRVRVMAKVRVKATACINSLASAQSRDIWVDP